MASYFAAELNDSRPNPASCQSILSMDAVILPDSEFRKFRELIYSLTGIAMSEEKHSLVQSRLQRRLRYHGLTSFGDYYAMVGGAGADGDEIGEFINCVTTNTTSFFREPHHFDFVAKKVIPELADRVRRGEAKPKLRIWHAGCSSGEEPYTLSITLNKALSGRGEWDVRQLCSDIDTDVLARAESGIYPEDRVKGIPTDVLRGSFLRGKGEQDSLYRVKAHLREPLTFRQINLLDDHWPLQAGTKFDMIWCRNVVIYFDKPTQKKLFARYQERLKPGGYLFIGHSESLLGVSDAFESLGQTIYRLPETGSRSERLAA